MSNENDNYLNVEYETMIPDAGSELLQDPFIVSVNVNKNDNISGYIPQYSDVYSMKDLKEMTKNCLYRSDRSVGDLIKEFNRRDRDGNGIMSLLDFKDVMNNMLKIESKLISFLFIYLFCLYLFSLILLFLYFTWMKSVVYFVIRIMRIW